jgi:predicted phosphodiesterase
MSEVKRPPRPQRKGLLFSSTTSQWQQQHRSLSGLDEFLSADLALDPLPKTGPVKIRILILSDTHGYASLAFPLLSDVPLDAAIHCGDLSQCGSLSDYQNTLDLLRSIPAPIKLVIAGNHDLSLNLSGLARSETRYAPDLTERQSLHTQAQRFWTGKEARDSGIKFLAHGFHEVELENKGILKIYATPCTPFPPGVDASEWAFGYKSNEDLYNPPGTGIWYSTPSGLPKTEISEERKGEVDILISHGPPRYRLDRTEEGENVGCKNLWRAVRRIKPRVHCFGHVHAGYGAEVVRWTEEKGDLPKDDDVEDGIEKVRNIEGEIGEGFVRFIIVEQGTGVKETLFVNAALMGQEMLEEMPWIVEMELKMADFERQQEA